MSSSLGLKLFCGFYFGLLLLNLHQLPLPWIDEIGYLDPAWNWFINGIYGSNLWPHFGADRLFVAHLPTLQWLHYLDVLLLPKSVWFSRVIPVVGFGIGLLYWAKYSKRQGLNGWLLVVLMVLFACDRSVFEALRSMRMENLELLFLGVIFYRISHKKNIALTGVFIGLLVLTHPKVWMIALVAFLWLFWYTKPWRSKCLLTAFTLLPIVFFLWTIDFDFTALQSQLLDHGSDHTASTVKGNIFFKHFIGRYLLYQPKTEMFEWYYHTQPYVVVIAFLGLFFAVKALVKKKKEEQWPLFEVALVANHMYWLFVVGPFQKYNMVVLMMSYLIVIKYNIPRIQCAFTSKWFRILRFPILALVIFPVGSRHAGAITQWNNRNVARFNSWVSEKTIVKPDNKVLFIECASMWYQTRLQPNQDFQFQFWLFNNSFSDYDQVYLITHQDLPFKLVSTYPDQSEEWSKRINNYGGITHKGLHIYQLNEKDYTSLIEFKRMRKN